MRFTRGFLRHGMVPSDHVREQFVGIGRTSRHKVLEQMRIIQQPHQHLTLFVGDHKRFHAAWLRMQLLQEIGQTLQSLLTAKTQFLLRVSHTLDIARHLAMQLSNICTNHISKFKDHHTDRHLLLHLLRHAQSAQDLVDKFCSTRRLDIHWCFSPCISVTNITAIRRRRVLAVFPLRGHSRKVSQVIFQRGLGSLQCLLIQI
mmetsp:Transcript_35001/g.56202  ORF Transcript_35001/g.56202 Transcript_35001/m.56202 type:complete len:202 (-) Transcript_35001:1394-1999(-)